MAEVDSSLWSQEAKTAYAAGWSVTREGCGTG